MLRVKHNMHYYITTEVRRECATLYLVNCVLLTNDNSHDLMTFQDLPLARLA